MLPKSVDPIRLCKQGVTFEGSLKLAHFPRVQALFDQDDRVVSVTLTFDISQNRILFIRGQIKSSVKLLCQRCNQEMDEMIEAEFLLSPVSSELQAKKLPEPYEPLVVNEEHVVIADIIEDEVLLALPMVSKHGVCIK